MAATRRAQIAIRAAVVITALAIIYLRTPSTFSFPQLWAEDTFFFSFGRTMGWGALFETLAGYHVTAQMLVGIFASYFSPIFTPAVFNYSAVALTLLVVWLITSPRLDLPGKPLLALAVVVVPMAYEELGTISNIQWVLPFGAFALLFMRRAPGILTLVGEATFLGITAVSGPFSLFLTPLFFWRCFAASEPSERQRLLILTAVVGLGAAFQVLALLTRSGVPPLAPIAYSWTLWINLPFHQIFTTFGPASQLFNGVSGFILGVGCILLFAALALKPPFSAQKLAMLFLASSIALGGMWRNRSALETQFDGMRYFYCGSVFVLWFLCCLSMRRPFKLALFGFVAAVELLLLPVVAGTPRITIDKEWRVWARYVDSGLPVAIPISPGSWFIDVPPAADGPLARFATSIGRPFLEVIKEPALATCSGSIGLIERVENPTAAAIHANGLWKVEGSAWESATLWQVQFVMLVNSAGTVVGVGYPGFESSGFSSAPPRSKWISYFSPGPGEAIHAYGVLKDGRAVCRLAGERRLSSTQTKLVSGSFTNAVEIIPGREITQRFKPDAILGGIAVQFVTFGRKPSSYAVNWRVTATYDGVKTEIGSGVINASAVADWMAADLPVSLTRADVPTEIEVALSTPDKAQAPIGLPLFSSYDESVPAAKAAGEPFASNGRLGLRLHYPH
jgi:hypothetical protein